MKPVLHTDVNKKRVAALSVLGLTTAAIAKELKLDRDTVDRILALPDVKDMIDEIGDDAIRAAKSRLRSRISSLADKIYDALEYQLSKKKSIQAAALGVKIMGLDQQTDSNQSGNITVVLPGSVKPDMITIDAEGKQVKPDKK